MSKLSTEICSYFQSGSAQLKGQGKVLNILQLKHYVTEKCAIFCANYLLLFQTDFFTGQHLHSVVQPCVTYRGPFIRSCHLINLMLPVCLGDGLFSSIHLIQHLKMCKLLKVDICCVHSAWSDVCWVHQLQADTFVVCSASMFPVNHPTNGCDLIDPQEILSVPPSGKRNRQIEWRGWSD